MGHCTAPHLAGYYSLAEVFEGDVGPDITAEVDEDDIDTPHSIEYRPEVVVIINLCSHT